MDTKRFFTSMLIAGALMLVFMYFTGRMGGGAGAASTTTAYSIYSAIPAEPTAWEGDPTPTPILLGGAGKGDASVLAVRVDNVTAGIDSVQFNVKDYASTYKKTDPLTLFPSSPEQANAFSTLARPFCTLGIHITVGDQAKELSYGSIRLKKANGGDEVRDVTEKDSAEDISLANNTNVLAKGYVWKVDEVVKDKDGIATDAVLSMSFEVTDPATYVKTPIARVTKRFHIDPKSYDMTITHTVENLTDKALHVRIDQLAAPAPGATTRKRTTAFSMPQTWQKRFQANCGR